MSKREVLMRYNVIIKKLKRAPSTFKEIEAELNLQSELHEYDLKISKRTFQRDVEDICSLYQISIEYNQSCKKYEIINQDDENLSDRILDAFDTLNALNASVGYSNHLDLEKRKSTGGENFLGILHAIKNRQQLEINYQSYWDIKPANKKLEPYQLKEFKNRWYLVAKDIIKNEMRIYGLDRIHEITISKKMFTYPSSFDPRNYFKDSFGIIRNNSDYIVENVVLSFSAFQGKYIKSLPFHSSQEVLSDNDDGLIIKLKIYVTYDFEMELLSYGPNVKILEPEFLRESIKEKLKSALSLYS